MLHHIERRQHPRDVGRRTRGVGIEGEATFSPAREHVQRLAPAQIGHGAIDGTASDEIDLALFHDLPKATLHGEQASAAAKLYHFDDIL
jgi:hypothetical protein